MKKELEPVATFCLRPGQSRDYHGTTITRKGSGLKVNGFPEKTIADFSRTFGVGGSVHVFAALRDNKVSIFEGPTIGQGMISEKDVREAVGL